jgi:putative transposase
MNKAFKYRLYPTAAQETAMKATLEECRWLYNHFLEERKIAYEQTGSSPSLYEQNVSLPALKWKRPSLAMVYSQVLQNVAGRVDLAFAAFFRRVRAGEKEPGYPRFRGKGRYDSFCYPQSGFKVVGERVHLSRIGAVKAIFHRPLEGEVKTCCVRRTSMGKWYVTVSCDVAPTVLEPRESAVGLDVGLTSFATLSNGEKIGNPRFLRCDERRLKRAQRRREKAPKGSVLRRKRRKIEAHMHERIANRRSNFAHQEARKVVNAHGIICVENLAINQMVHNHCLAKSIHDAAWRQFLTLLAYKAECAGRQLVQVNAAYTTQDCSNPTCGQRQDLSLSERVYLCPCCGLEIDRDLNAARNIVRLGLQSLAQA